MSQNFFSMNTFIPFSNKFSFTLSFQIMVYKLVSRAIKFQGKNLKRFFMIYPMTPGCGRGKHLIAISPIRKVFKI